VDGAAVIVRLLAAWGVALALAMPALAASPDDRPPSVAEVKAAHRSSDAVLLDRRGVPLGGARIDTRVRRLDWVALDDVSPAMAAALVSAEDKRFWEHDGVDWTGLAGAAWDSVWRIVDGRRPRGGSTLTMQLAGLVDPSLRARGGETRTFAMPATRVEAMYAPEMFGEFPNAAWTVQP
jgi:penicillin-binding protein 1C